MENQNRQKLFSQFPPVATSAWEDAITADLKGADYNRKLVWQTGEGFEVRPYYRAEDLKEIPFAQAAPGEFPFVRGTRKCNCWKIHQTIKVEDPEAANAEAVKALEAGTQSLGFNFTAKNVSQADLDTLLDGIDLKKTPVVFCGGHAVATVAKLMTEKVRAMGEARGEVRASFIIDPYINCLTLKGAFGCSEDGGKCIGKMASLVKDAEGLKMRFAGVNGQKFNDCGATITQELAFTLAVGHEYMVRMMEAGLSADQAAGTIRFSVSVGANYFMEIAKIRAARMLWANIVKAYDPKCGCSEKMNLHAVTSRWNQTVYDPYVNMLRGTTEAMSAAIAGVDSLEVLPFDATMRPAGAFSSRIARNTQLLLRHESHFDQVADPAGGSYYIEKLTAMIASAAWDIFKQVEEKGGYMAAFRAGWIQQQVEASATKAAQQIATRRRTLLGTNQFPNFAEKADESVTAETVIPGCGCSCACESKPGAVEPLRPFRGAMPFEQLRLRVDRSGRRPKAFMLTCGSLAFARARAQFSCNFFACAGIEVIDNTHFASLEEGAKAALAAGAEIVVICSSDDEYATLAPQAKELIGDKAILVVAGAPACQSELEEGGIRNFISVKSNVLDTLKYYLKELSL
ncbi:MAG: acyl-CoA mutase large subunit family protein [Rikenellaceae bacterium]|jgi:methylmalonyl-CoA mutase|nr:acyl-CoA mutase large subunit family protein [Rikenellaceae bacterium]